MTGIGRDDWRASEVYEILEAEDTDQTHPWGLDTVVQPKPEAKPFEVVQPDERELNPFDMAYHCQHSSSWGELDAKPKPIPWGKASVKVDLPGLKKKPFSYAAAAAGSHPPLTKKGGNVVPAAVPPPTKKSKVRLFMTTLSISNRPIASES